MSQLFTLPKQVVVSASGAPYANATATFYRAGTSTLHTVYATPELDPAHPNPVQADSTGTFPAIWLDDLSPYQYRVVILDQNGFQLMDESLAGSLSSSDGNVVMEAPVTGITLTVNQTAGQAGDGIRIAAQSGVGNYASLNLYAPGAREYRVIAESDNGSLLIRDQSAAAVRYELTSAGVHRYFGATGQRAISVRGPTSQWAGIDLVDGNVGNQTWTLLSGHPSTGVFSIFDVTGAAPRVSITPAGATTVSDGIGNLYPIGYSDIPRLTSGFVAGKCTALTAGATINTADLYTGKAFSIYNNSAGSITITEGASVTLRLAGTASTGNRTLAARGFATFWCNSATEVVGTGAGLS